MILRLSLLGMVVLATHWGGGKSHATNGSKGSHEAKSRLRTVVGGAKQVAKHIPLVAQMQQRMSTENEPTASEYDTSHIDGDIFAGDRFPADDSLEGLASGCEGLDEVLWGGKTHSGNWSHIEGKLMYHETDPERGEGIRRAAHAAGLIVIKSDHDKQTP